MEWTADQKKILSHAGSTLTVGVPGSGKTVLLLAQAEALAKAGHKVALVTFAFRSHQYLKSMATPAQAAIWSQFASGTVRDLAIQQLHTAGQSFSFASNNKVREILRTLIASQSFPGTLEDAEHVIRAAKARAKKLPEADRYYPFVQAYKERLDELGLADRHDIIRRHVIGMKDGSIPPLQVSHILLDNVQDATELQLIWLQMHLANGVTLKITGDDDVTAFGPDGAQGESAFTTIESWPGFSRFDLTTSHRIAAPLAPAVGKIARQLRTRISKNLESSTGQGAIRAEIFPNRPAEHAFLAETCLELARQGHQVGLITRTHFEAACLSHALRKYNLNPASYARLIWDEPTPRIILSLLYIMLGQATNAHLMLVMLGFGIPATTATMLFQMGLDAQSWAANGYPLPDLPNESPTTVAAIQQLRRSLRGAAQLLLPQSQQQGINPRSVFKSLVAELLPNIPEAEHPSALLATDMLLSLSGKLTEVLPRVRTESLPDMSSSVTVAPVRETRNQQFHTVIIPYASSTNWPMAPSKLLGADADHERRLFYLAATRMKADLILTRHTPEASPFLIELQQSLKQQARKAA